MRFAFCPRCFAELTAEQKGRLTAARSVLLRAHRGDDVPPEAVERARGLMGQCVLQLRRRFREYTRTGAARVAAAAKGE